MTDQTIVLHDSDKSPTDLVAEAIALCRPTTEERFKAKLSAPTKSGCLEWLGSISRQGYGWFWSDAKKNVTSHRYAYRLAFGEIPDGMLVCHTCDNRKCCNPDHLWVGTSKDNVADMFAKGRNPKFSQTHCKYGHEFNEENTRIRGFRRVCLICERQKTAKYAAKLKAKRLLGVRK